MCEKWPTTDSLCQLFLCVCVCVSCVCMFVCACCVVFVSVVSSVTTSLLLVHLISPPELLMFSSHSH